MANRKHATEAIRAMPAIATLYIKSSTTLTSHDEKVVGDLVLALPAQMLPLGAAVVLGRVLDLDLLAHVAALGNVHCIAGQRVHNVGDLLLALVTGVCGFLHGSNASVLIIFA